MTKNKKVVFDTYAWIELFHGTEKGKVVLSYVEESNGLTPIIVLAELSAYFDRKKIQPEERFAYLEVKTTLVDFSPGIAKQAGKTRQKMRQDRPNFGLADAIIFETARSYGAELITGDPHFKGLSNVIFLE